VIRFRSESDPAPERIETLSDRTTAREALERMRENVHVLYQGDERGLRQLYAAIKKRSAKPPKPADPEVSLADLFHRDRARKSSEHRVLSRLLVELDGEYRLTLAHASDVAAACEAAWGPADGQPRLVPYRELLGIVGAYEWQRNGIEIEGVGRIHPHYGVFAPTRPSYVDLCREAAFEPGRTVVDVGTGTGVLACLFARRGAARVLAVDLDPRAVRCARENVERLGLRDRVHVVRADLFPDDSLAKGADLFVANPPWLPGVARTSIERAIFDPKSEFLERYLAGLAERLDDAGEGWLILSDLAERLGLRGKEEVVERARRHGLTLRWELSRPSSKAATDASADPISAARCSELVFLRCFGRS
jgi:SAM-dependent methyltransferase